MQLVERHIWRLLIVILVVLAIPACRPRSSADGVRGFPLKRRVTPIVASAMG